MNTTILNYPGFQTWPKEIKRMLLASETHFFNQPVRGRARAANYGRTKASRFNRGMTPVSLKTRAERARHELAAFESNFGEQWLAPAGRC